VIQWQDGRRRKSGLLRISTGRRPLQRSPKHAKRWTIPQRGVCGMVARRIFGNPNPGNEDCLRATIGLGPRRASPKLQRPFPNVVPSFLPAQSALSESSRSYQTFDSFYKWAILRFSCPGLAVYSPPFCIHGALHHRSAELYGTQNRRDIQPRRLLMPILRTTFGIFCL
jgi:hypothetical protein